MITVILAELTGNVTSTPFIFKSFSFTPKLKKNKKTNKEHTFKGLSLNSLANNATSVTLKNQQNQILIPIIKD